MAKRLIKNRKIPVILLEYVKGLGHKFDTVDVAPIYAKNVLLPNNKAVLATPHAMHNLDKKMKKHEEEMNSYVSSLEGLISKIEENGGLVITRKVNEQQHLYDKVGANDVAASLNEKYNVDINPDLITLPHRIEMV
jgi:large subunit ribosomal protein L9